ncbi:MAG TPA: PQQ-like beta-propeller repeat protein [Pirellulaceae bacterium]|nr:PQQ-like beta-propeller repeat protein [Pirellulaceae bacterium]HMO91878.1 PQQ-like beta-propeller repeat protein [Pirellulaceae bacterium]HMP69712.1 PQQ-like beta-propeller repeat protein [Pirellulaceae bacterium]
MKTKPMKSVGGNACRLLAICQVIISVVATTFLVAPSLVANDVADWVHWRGPELNGISREKNLPADWSPKGENLVWMKPEFATRCTPIAMNGRLYFVTRSHPETNKEGERTVCVDAATGELIWESVHNVFLSDGPAERVGWSAVIGDPATGNVYVLGLGCLFQCLNGETGEIIWERSMSEEYGLLSTYGGRTNFPVVFENLVIVSGVMTQYGANAVPAHRFVAFDKLTGEAIWFTSTRVRPEDTTYSTPIFTTFNGQAAMVVGSSDGALYAFQPRTGKIIWWYDASARGFNTTPLVVDGMVYCGHAEKNRADTNILGAAFALDGRKLGQIQEEELLWKINYKTINRSAPLLVDGRLYMVEDGATILTIDPATGKILHEKKVGRTMFGSLLYADGKIYCAEANGNVWIFRPTDQGLEQLSRVRLPQDEIFSSPIAYRGRIYLTTTEGLYCIGLPDAEVQSDPVPQAPPEAPLTDRTVAHIQIVPVEGLLNPGDKVDYRVLSFNEVGQFLGNVEAKFELQGVGSLSAAGNYVAPNDNAHSVVMVSATFNGISSQARARIVPPLPWKFDFNDGQVPGTWIGAAYRHQPAELDGEKMLVKVSTIPKGTRSQSWMGHANLHDYTIQADFYATEQQGMRADMGLINQRYTLDLMASNQLQIRSWTPRLELRFAKTIPFDWQANVWYTMKFQSENKDGSAILRGKVWKRGEPEPGDWAIEAADATPNVIGSPGLFGNSSRAEYYIDNVQVFANQ